MEMDVSGQLSSNGNETLTKQMRYFCLIRKANSTADERRRVIDS